MGGGGGGGGAARSPFNAGLKHRSLRAYARARFCVTLTEQARGVA